MDDNLRRVDMAALETLLQVYRHSSFTAAAEALAIKQSSVSYTIERLRKSFGDPLFIRQGNTIIATDRCIDVVQAAERILAEVEEAAAPSQFDPASVKARITISVTYLSRFGILPGLVAELRKEAPGISLDLITGFTDASQHLLSGKADMALSPVEINASGINGKYLFQDPYICLMDPENSLAKGKLTLERFAEASHLVIHYGQKWTPPYRKALLDTGFDIKTAVSTANPEDVEFLVPKTDLVVTMPSMIARQFGKKFHLCPCPIDASAMLNFYWPARLNNSPIHEWIRKKVFRIAEDFIAR